MKKEFIEKAKEVHGDKYDYSKVEYVNNHTKVCIICPEHGEFWQVPKNHLKGCGCSKCSNVYKMTGDDFVEKAKKIHGDKYDYSKVKYIDNKTKVCIICPEHGEFWQIPNNHLRGEGCILCRNDEMSKKRRKDVLLFIEKAKEVHGDKYDYSKVEYINNHTKVCIICPEHGEFWQVPNNHVHGQGCPYCYKQGLGKKIKNEKRIKIKTIKKDFVEKAKEIHGDKYDYSKVNYINTNTKVCIICPEHGEFWQIPYKHLCGQGCPHCGRNKNKRAKTSQEEYIKKAREVHGNKYDYSKTIYEGSKSKVCIICPEHGEFWQNANSHLSGCGCPECASKARSKKQASTNEEFIKKSFEKYGDLYDYKKVKYCNNTTPVEIVCHKKNKNGEEHGSFFVSPKKFLSRGCVCPFCSTSTSMPEKEIYEYICSLVGKENVIHNDRIILNGYELDVYIPLMKIAFEFNGLFWHSEYIAHINKNSHYNKTIECEKKGIKLFQIFSDEYFEKKDIVFNKIKHVLGKCIDYPKIYGRKCDIRKIDKNIAKDFLNKYHIQGTANATVRLGAYYNDELIAVMTFLEEEKNSNKWELNRFASNYNYVCCGVGGKLFNYFVKNYNPNEIKSFADRRWTVDMKNNLYTQLGFSFDKYITPDYRYVNKNNPGNGRIHKFNFRKQVLHRKYGLPLTMTEKEMTEQLGYYRVWDCGLIKYVWKKEI